MAHALTPGDFRPAASLDILRRRAALFAKLRRFFDERGFLEVETPLLSHDVVVDRHLDPLPVTLFTDARNPTRGPTLWLQTSPEFAMKRLLAAYGMEGGSSGDPLSAIYQITRAFRGGEAGRLHNPEFTIVEWYRVGDGYAEGMRLLDDLASGLLGTEPSERLTYRDAFQRYAGIDPFAESGATVPVAPEILSNSDRDVLLDYLLTTRVEPHLGRDRPTILYDYPASQAALARSRPGDPPIAERFELYVNGIELANGYHELLDPAVLCERNRLNNQLRAAEGKYTLPEESWLLAAMEHGLPACSGCALGFERLVMVATGAKSIEEVMAFPLDRA